MILVFLSIILTLLGIVFIKNSDEVSILNIFGRLLSVMGFCGLITFGSVVIIRQLSADNIIHKNRIQYDGLCRRYEILKSEYEDVSKSEVIGDITAWNMEVYNTKYWSENLWTNWFNPKIIADNLEYIPLE